MLDLDTERLYVGHLRDALVLARGQQARLMTVNSIMSIALMALALGIVSAGDKVEIGGLSLQFPLSTLILGATTVTAVLYVLFMAITRYAEFLEGVLWDRYRGLGIEKPPDERMSPFASSSPLESAVSGRLAVAPARTRLANWVDVVTTVCVASSILLLPAAAQLAGVIVVANAYGSLWAWLLLGIPLLSLLSLLGWLTDRGFVVPPPVPAGD